MESQESQVNGDGDELREEDVTREDNLDDKVSEGADLPEAQAAGTAEGEDNVEGTGPSEPPSE